MKAYKPMVHPMASQDLWAKTNFPPLLPPEFHKQQGRPKKTKISSVGEPSPSSIPKAKHLPRYHHRGKRRQHIKPTHQLRELQDNQGKNNQSYQRLKKGPIITKHLLSLTKLLNHLTNQLNHLKLLLSLTKLLNHLTNHLNHLTNQLNHLKHLSLNNHLKHLSLNKPLKLLSLNKHLKLLSLNKPLKLLSLNKPLKLLCLNKPPNLKNQIRLSPYKLPHKGKLGLSLQLRGKTSRQSLSHEDIENLSSVFAVSWGTHMFLGRNCLFRI
ncbi:hypothetical protein L3X38_004144 [Prunus dulcis]|uniref:Uncharacterized protein n=1 Tax=Prunus dulcis TaxID=3755 RepID=A0AAD4ZND5_PRUDU|nr:hypothetical protein L3X38_004144 [Prunus dulcis]